jgi:hypothetical protein
LMTAQAQEREVLTMAAEGGLTEFDDLLRLLGVIEEQIQEGKKKVQKLSEQTRLRERGMTDE